MATIATGAAWRPIPQNFGGAMRQSYGLVLHVQAGNNSPQGWFSRPGTDASSHWWVGKDGTLEQYVDADRASWAQAGGNSTYHSVETEGYPNEKLTAAQEATLAKLYRWGHDRFGWPYKLAERPGEQGFGWHGMGGAAWGNHPSCPGDLRKGRRQAILDAAQAGGAPAPAPKPPTDGPKPAPKPTPPAAKAPALHVDYFGRSHNARHKDVAIWQQRMRDRGWKIDVDSVYGPRSEQVCRQFQREKGLAVDGLVGPKTWAAAWTAPIT